MKYTEPYREKYRSRARMTTTDPYDVQTIYTPAGSKDVLRLCDAVDTLTVLVEDAVLWLGNTSKDSPAHSEMLRNRMNMILMRL